MAHLPQFFGLLQPANPQKRQARASCPHRTVSTQHSPHAAPEFRQRARQVGPWQPRKPSTGNGPIPTPRPSMTACNVTKKWSKIRRRCPAMCDKPARSSQSTQSPGRVSLASSVWPCKSSGLRTGRRSNNAGLMTSVSASSKNRTGRCCGQALPSPDPCRTATSKPPRNSSCNVVVVVTAISTSGRPA